MVVRKHRRPQGKANDAIREKSRDVDARSTSHESPNPPATPTTTSRSVIQAARIAPTAALSRGVKALPAVVMG